MAAFAALSAGVLLLAGILDIVFAAREQKALIAERQELIARNAADKVEGFFQEKIGVMEKAVSLGGLAEGAGGRGVLEKLLGRELSFLRVALWDRQGRRVSTVSRRSSLMKSRLTDPDAAKLIPRDVPWRISPLYIDEMTGEPLVVIAVRATDLRNRFRGALMAEVNLKFMWELVSTLKVGRTGSAYVVDERGNLVACGDTSRVLKGENVAGLEEVREFTSGGAGPRGPTVKVTRGFTGRRALTTHADLGVPPWAVVVELPREEAYGPLLRLVAMSALALLLSFVLAAWAGAYMSGRITRPVVALRDAVRDVGRGRRDARIAIASPEEIGELAKSFNDMVRDLGRTEAEAEKLQSGIIQAEKMAAVGRLASGAAHEINNPMTVILGFAQSLLAKIKEGDPFHMPVSSIEREARRCKNFVQEMLLFSRSGGLKKESSDVNAVIKQALVLVEAQGKMKGVELATVFCADLPPATVNQGQVQQVVVNLCNNAIDAMPRGGRLTVGTRRADGLVEISVSDTGEGMPAEVRCHIFEPFFTTKAAGQGTGLGLSLCYDIVQRHGGTIEVASEAGKGTTFVVKLPLHASP